MGSALCFCAGCGHHAFFLLLRGCYLLKRSFTSPPLHPTRLRTQHVEMWTVWPFFVVFVFMLWFFFCVSLHQLRLLHRSALPSTLFCLLLLLPLASVLPIFLSSFFYLFVTTTLADCYRPLSYYFVPCSFPSITSTLLPFSLSPIAPLRSAFSPLPFTRAHLMHGWRQARRQAPTRFAVVLVEIHSPICCSVELGLHYVVYFVGKRA